MNSKNIIGNCFVATEFSWFSVLSGKGVDSSSFTHRKLKSILNLITIVIILHNECRCMQVNKEPQWN
jgi:hypothetical protein